MPKSRAMAFLSRILSIRKKVNMLPNVITSAAIHRGIPFDVSYVLRKCATNSSLERFGEELDRYGKEYALRR